VFKHKIPAGGRLSIEVTQAQTALEMLITIYTGFYDALVSKVDLDKAYGRIQ
jgi:outer membrane protein